MRPRDLRSQPPPPLVASVDAGQAVSVRALRPLFAYSGARRFDVAAICARAGIAVETALDPNARIAHETLLRVWAVVEESLGDPDLGLHVLEAIDLRLLDLGSVVGSYVVLNLFANSANVGDGLARFARYYCVAHAQARVAVEPHGSGVDVRMSFGEQSLPRQPAEYYVGSLAGLIAVATSDAVAPTEVFFTHAAPPSVREHTRVLRCPVTFSAPASGLRLPEAALRTPLVTAQPALLRIAQRRAEDQADELRERDPLVRAVRRCIREDVGNRSSSTERVAGKLGMSVRTLARKLRSSGTSYQRLLEDVRREVAVQSLLDPSLTLADVAALLGFAEQSAFNRAFKRWYSASPGEFRRGARNAG